ncbi:biliverdin-producing heme oxygenase [Nocardioides sp. GY 10127]|uniref:biliverdin-producing heme oxygenase n=1 Tax=Nocardioides sp. GY 10127 TaxID=2569762 RepID=UPI0010A80827|nr:biliverdin-producing heme oxygenase [Nocardioides sp. GY 10127]TIC84277.1 biliverdin-producing heme oxygenase [Nocardioides sp. GY 10127]
MSTPAPAIPLPTTAPLSVAMRDGSRAEHEAAESSAFMATLLDGGIEPSGYAAYLRRLRRVYEALERVGRACAADPLVAAVHDPAIERLGAIDTDLEHWAAGPGATDLDEPVDSPAVDAYVARIEAAGAWGGAYVAHHYTRYLGDLSGGQAIGRVLERHYDLDGAGVAFYEFPAVPKPKPYKDGYRSRLDALDLSEEEVARVVAEVQEAFRLNQALFLELDAELGLSRA